ncbi:hypothetical protein HETIRDRAFT_449679 [Heterobasidion irregulare TC 32-1]|uniref:Uncharacterized protein n=1 Tax=Heterobasidion irregulare (strain TC 32-1) TaxID=747525 RepID=W4KGB2_HETIT|nr:uncharacterized protein HETIRDRAFT_449679 [Heterobasidion irregulare TC 32-1]ETW84111.1 hypothetical protein HETIRDRAFT_449679 [Heterobasidion irregulare TC 32-1]
MGSFRSFARTTVDKRIPARRADNLRSPLWRCRTTFAPRRSAPTTFVAAIASNRSAACRSVAPVLVVVVVVPAVPDNSRHLSYNCRLPRLSMRGSTIECPARSGFSGRSTDRPSGNESADPSEDQIPIPVAKIKRRWRSRSPSVENSRFMSSSSSSSPSPDELFNARGIAYRSTGSGSGAARSDRSSGSAPRRGTCSPRYRRVRPPRVPPSPVVFWSISRFHAEDSDVSIAAQTPISMLTRVGAIDDLARAMRHSCLLLLNPDGGPTRIGPWLPVAHLRCGGASSGNAEWAQVV